MDLKIGCSWAAGALFFVHSNGRVSTKPFSDRQETGGRGGVDTRLLNLNVGAGLKKRS